MLLSSIFFNFHQNNMSKSSKNWLREHFNDPYVKRAQKEGYRSRAAFKLIEIQERDHLIKPGMIVVDLGAAPGGWSQVAAQWVGRKGKIIALDILPMDPIASVEFIEGDFTQPIILDQLLGLLAGQAVDVVLSDMAPNMSGMDVIDQPRAMYLAELALDFAKDVLKPQGALLIKMFQGQGSDQFIKLIRENFTKVLIRKPKSSRSRSNEVYILGFNKRFKK